MQAALAAVLRPRPRNQKRMEAQRAAEEAKKPEIPSRNPKPQTLNP